MIQKTFLSLQLTLFVRHTRDVTRDQWIFNRESNHVSFIYKPVIELVKILQRYTQFF